MRDLVEAPSPNPVPEGEGVPVLEVIDLATHFPTAAGTVYVHVRYVDAPSGQTQLLSFSVRA